jgi:glutaredoxin
MKVFMYALSTCPWCRKAKQFFKENNIPFDFVDYDLQPEAEQEKIMEKMVKLAGATSFPVVLIENQVVVGYNPEKYAEILGIKKGKVV